MTRPLVLAWMFAVMHTFTSVANAADKYALLVGVAKYDHAEMNKPEALQFPEKDAKALGDLLKTGGYEIELLLGKAATQKAIREKLEGLKQKADSDGVVLIGLFGHGVEMETVDAAGTLIKDGCFCPYDTAIREALDFRGKPVPGPNKKTLIEPDPGTLIKLAELMRALKLAKAGNRIVLADCCRTTPNAARTFGANFNTQDLPENTSLLFGCSPGEKAFEHEDWGHGAFTKCLLDAISELSAEGSVDTAQLASQMKKRVPALVATVSGSSFDTQTPKPFITDAVDLQLAIMASGILGQRAGEVREFTDLKIKFCWCPQGRMVDSETGEQRDLQINGFWLSETEVTQSQWRSVMNTQPWIEGRKTRQGDEFPATYISYSDAEEFCRLVTKRERDTAPVPARIRFTLPSEDQWVYACLAGKPDPFLTASDEEIRQLAWLDATTKHVGEEWAHEVKKKVPNEWGLADMHGNVAEWCRSTAQYKPCRGGSWLYAARLCRSDSRSDFETSSKFNDVGFRLAIESTPNQELQRK